MQVLTPSTSSLSRPFLWLGIVAALLVLATLSLWSYYGTTVFFELVRAGWAACF